MNKNKAFSLMEVIVSVFILILVLIPSVKLNIQQIKTYSRIRNADSELHFYFFKQLFKGRKYNKLSLRI